MLGHVQRKAGVRVRGSIWLELGLISERSANRFAREIWSLSSRL